MKYENAHSSSDEYEESWPRPWKNGPERNGSAEKPPDKVGPSLSSSSFIFKTGINFTILFAIKQKNCEGTESG